MHYLKDGQWLESVPEIELTADGAAATRGPHQVYFPGDISQGVIQIVTPEGERLRSRPLGFSYFDGSNSVLIAELKSSVGQLLPARNQVIYEDAFTDFKADLLCTYTKAGFECDVILRQQPPAPREYAMDAATTRLQLLTEFFDNPTPEQHPQAVDEASTWLSFGPTNSQLAALTPAAASAAATLPEVELQFGSMRMVAGRAFSLDAQAQDDVRVFKSWAELEGRSFLVEEVLFPAIEPYLQPLAAPEPPKDGQASTAEPVRHRVSAKRLLPPERKLAQSAGTIRLAKADIVPRNGCVLDYQTIFGTKTNYVFQGDQTYYVSGAFYAKGVTTIEGGAVIKYTNSSTARVSLSGALDCRTGPYRPAVFTSKDDDTLGESIPGSTGSPSNNTAIFLEDTSNANNVYRHLRFSYARAGVSVRTTGGANEFWHCQFGQCGTAISNATAAAKLYNLLVANCGTAFRNFGWFTATHATFDQCTTLASVSTPSASSLTNSIITAVANVHTNLFLSHCLTNATGSGIYQAAGGGAYYLANSSQARNAGTIDIYPSLSVDLRQLTTYPPVVYSNAAITTEQTLGPQAQRDNDMPDLGYHYYPLDYVFGGVDACSNLTFLPGTAVGWFRTSSGWTNAGHGIHLENLARATFDGRVDLPTYWVRCNTVQEGVGANWAGGYGPGGITGSAAALADAPQLHARFLRCSMLGTEGNHFSDDNGYLVATIKDTEFWNGALGGAKCARAFTNCLMERVPISLTNGTGDANLVMRNCTVRGGSLTVNRGDQPAYKSLVRDCAFDGTTNSTSDAYADDPSYTDYDYNAFLSGATRTYPTGTNDKVVASFSWLRGALGRYYLPTNSSLIDADNLATAADAGLYHYTVRNDQIKETNSVLDIGYHYVAVAGSNSTIWVEDMVPVSATNAYRDNWNWQSTNPAPYSGTSYHRSVTTNAMHEHYFSNAMVGLSLSTDDTLLCGLFLGPGNLPTQVMFRYQTNYETGSWSHRVFWGTDSITNWTTRACMGALPGANGWVRLEVPAREIGLANCTLRGLGFALYDGTAAWDYAGKITWGGPIDTDLDGLPDYVEDANGNGTSDQPADAGETNWHTYNSQNGLGATESLQVFTPLK